MSERLTVILDRHGAVNNPDGVLYFRNLEVELSPEGHSQMQRLGDLLKKRGINPVAIYTSTHSRAVESAKEIAKSFPEVPIVRSKELQDVDAPALSSKTVAWVITKRLLGKDVFSESENKGEMESRKAVAERMLRFLKQLSEKHSGRTVVVISHADPIFYLRYRLKHPHKPLPTRIGILTLLRYPKIGQAIRIVLDKNFELVEETKIN